MTLPPDREQTPGRSRGTEGPAAVYRERPHTEVFVRHIALIFILLTAGCASTRGEGTGDAVVAGEPARVAGIVAAVFAAERIPVSRADDNAVESGRFVVEGWWGRDRVEERIECALELAVFVPVEMRVTATITRSFQRTLGAVPGTPTSRVSILSEGRTRAGPESRCWLAPAWAQHLLDIIAFRAGRAGGVAGS